MCSYVKNSDRSNVCNFTQNCTSLQAKASYCLDTRMEAWYIEDLHYLWYLKTLATWFRLKFNSTANPTSKLQNKKHQNNLIFLKQVQLHRQPNLQLQRPHRRLRFHQLKPSLPRHHQLEPRLPLWLSVSVSLKQNSFSSVVSLPYLVGYGPRSSLGRERTVARQDANSSCNMKHETLRETKG